MSKGVKEVNLATIAQLEPSITEADLESCNYPTDPNVGKGCKMVVCRGITIRCTRNLDKYGGFVNGAIAVLADVCCGV